MGTFLTSLPNCTSATLAAFLTFVFYITMS